MKIDILSELFYGNIVPNEKSFRDNSEYKKTAKRLADTEEKLNALLSEEEKKLLEKLISAQIAITSITAEEYFKDGFKTGFKIVLAALEDNIPVYIDNV